ncbi:MAG: undecaprenyl-diphosphate phosphatase [Tannerellaceae bacterium]
MSIIEVIIIAIVEGLTEFLPVSSTGHMIITQHLLGVESTPFVKAFTVIIQFGAILSVVCLYWKRFFRLNKCTVFDSSAVNGKQGLARWSTYARRFLYKFDFYWKLLVAFIPAAIIGFLGEDLIDSMLESVWVVAVMLVLGGVFMLFVDKMFCKVDKPEVMTERKAFYIGLSQCVAMIPGVSRSMATIVGGMAQKLSRKTAAEFSFFLAVPTMFAATAYKMLKLFMEPGGAEVIGQHMGELIIGNVVAFVVALLAIKFFIGFVTKYGFKAFGYYRIIVGGILLVMLLLGSNLQIV